MDKVKKQNGFILIVLLWTLLILGLIAASVVYSIRLELKKAGYSLNKVRALYAALGALEVAKAEINRDRNSYDSLNEPWSSNPYSYQFTFEDISFNLSVIDEERKVNVNSDDHEIIENLLRRNGMGNYKEISQSLYDWKDADSEKHKLGAESDYYSKLPQPYPCKNALLDTVDEILLVKGFTEFAFIGCAEYLTAHSNRRVNLNTASENILAALPGITPRDIKSIISYRRGIDGIDGTRDDRPFTSIQNALSSIDSATAVRLAPYVGVISTRFTVKIDAHAGNTKKKLECIALKRPFTVDIISWREF